eukprot:CAMPEP_0117660906 /NCGR_PEP_ID=MMETSP0804-20121206/7237_1 /TAXON_ID=1074897 /ORGANISM="Tetraselmis astigmatica, Strain CCMP880" /LENGTH=129 /DNA_ID=CAMNT_0005467705 /DNA_START=1049 /DNA_END=1438 /DNA_ORIENTATION=+
MQQLEGLVGEERRGTVLVMHYVPAQAHGLQPTLRQSNERHSAKERHDRHRQAPLRVHPVQLLLRGLAGSLAATKGLVLHPLGGLCVRHLAGNAAAFGWKQLDEWSSWSRPGNSGNVSGREFPLGLGTGF